MNTITRTPYTKLTVLAVLLLALVSLNSVFAWTTAPSNPPSNNTSAPVNVGSGTQAKLGALGVLDLTTLALRVDTDTNPNGTKLSINGNVSASAYCDVNGENCVSSTAMGTGDATSTNTTLDQAIETTVALYNCPDISSNSCSSQCTGLAINKKTCAYGQYGRISSDTYGCIAKTATCPYVGQVPILSNDSCQMVKATFYSDSSMTSVRDTKTVFYSSTQNIAGIGLDWDADTVPSSNTNLDRILYAVSYDDPYGWYVLFTDTAGTGVERVQLLSSNSATLSAVARNNRYMTIEYQNNCN